MVLAGSSFGAARLALRPGDSKPFLVIMVNTTQSAFTNSPETVASWVYPDTGGVYSMQDWIRESFGGQVHIAPCKESYGTANDGVVRVTVNMSNATVQQSFEAACKQAIQLADPYVNFAQYDTGHTGSIGPDQLEVLFLFTIPSYFGCATSFAWGAAPAPVLDGVSFDGYEVICYSESRDNIGAIIHDWLHLNGEEDFYSKDSSRFGVYQLHLGYIWAGDAGGLKNPTHMMPMSMENFAILRPQLVTESGEYDLRAWSTGSYNYLRIPTQDPKQYFLLENRQFDGFDQCLSRDISQPGVVIYHVDRNLATTANFDNIDMAHRMVTIEAANESRYGYNEYNVLGSAITNTDHNVLWHRDGVFSASTVPNSKLYDGRDSGVTIKVLSANGPVMRVQVTLPAGRNLFDLTDEPDGVFTSQYGGTPWSQGLEKLFDNYNETSYGLDRADGWVQFQTTARAILTGYALVSASDSPERDPHNWTLQGSNDGNTWLTLDTRTGITFANRGQTLSYTFANSTAYSYYRLSIANPGGSGLQLAELALYGFMPVAVSGVAVAPHSAAMAAGTTTQLTATVMPETARNKAVSWASSAPEVATVSNTGLVHSLAQGQATITATTAEGAFTDHCAVVVSGTMPTISAISPQILATGYSSHPIGFTIGDIETPAASLTLLARSDNPALLAPAHIVFGGSGANRSVILTPTAGQTGTALVEVQVTDSAGGTCNTQFSVAVTAQAMVDRNGDGISDVWAALYPSAGAPADDPDGDGQSNLAEAQAGTNPINPSSVFTAAVGQDQTGNRVVRWAGVAGKHYFLETSSDLITWSPLPGDYSGTDATLVAIVQPAGSSPQLRAFWHVVAFDADSDGNGLNDWEETHRELLVTVTASAGPNGSITPAGSTMVVKGGNLTYGITPASSYAIDKVLIDGIDRGALVSYSFNALDSPHAIEATFKMVSNLSVSPAAIAFTITTNTSITLTANIAWTAVSTQPWLTVATASGSGNATLTVTATANTSGASRSGEITIAGPAGSGLIRHIPVSQSVAASNLALGQPATASSREDSTFDAAKAVDGNATGTRWSSTFSDPQWLGSSRFVVGKEQNLRYGSKDE
jgi:M6 family metalloprotease-like protein